MNTTDSTKQTQSEQQPDKREMSSGLKFLLIAAGFIVAIILIKLIMDFII